MIDFSKLDVKESLEKIGRSMIADFREGWPVDSPVFSIPLNLTDINDLNANVVTVFYKCHFKKQEIGADFYWELVKYEVDSNPKLNDNVRPQ